MKQALKINPADNVAVAIQDLKKGTAIDIDGQSLTLQTDVPAGHKLALREIKKDENVIKYGFPIGHALHDIVPGAWLDHHDIKSNLKGELNYDNVHIKGLKPNDPHPTATFQGYRRANGKVGVRNELWVIPTVGCVNGIIREIVEEVKRLTNNGEGVDGIVDFPHNYGCSQLGDDHENTRKILRDLVMHPNAGGVLVVGLGCENNQPHDFEKLLGDYDHDRIKFMVCQEVEGNEVETGVKLLMDLYNTAKEDKRETVSASELRIGLKCGGSDGFSGITANPLLGAFSDWLCEEQGGTTILTEVPEMFGAETILMERCINDEVLEETKQLINNFKHYFLSHNQPVGENPSPGNKAGGISTLEDKALGCTQKSGKSPVCGVLGYGDMLQKKGLNLLSAPGNDLVAATALAAAGCQIVLFTTGRGTPFATAVPTLKVSSNSGLYNRKPNWVDFNAGPIVEDKSIEELLPSFTQLILDVASGKKVNAEKSGIQGIAIFKNGVTL
jgi:altronate hydrolase